MHFSGFSCKAYSKVDFGYVKILDAIFLGQFLLLSTSVLNDNNKMEKQEFFKTHQKL